MMFISVISLLLAACTANPVSTSGAPSAEGGASEKTVDTLALPAVPDSLTDPSDRSDYLLVHFWDDLSPADTARTHDRAFMEQNVVNFLYGYTLAKPKRIDEASEIFLNKFAGDPVARAIIFDLVDQYLTSPESPVFNDDTYISILSAWTRLPLSEYELEAPRYQLENALKNRPGTLPADFTYQTTEGRTSSLYAAAPDTELLLLLYDPDCDHCMETIAELRANDVINDKIQSGKLKVLAVYTEGNESLWHSTAPMMPDDWTIAIDRSSIMDGELYDVPEMPGLYLLDKDKKVILKNTNIKRLLEKLQ